MSAARDISSRRKVMVAGLVVCSLAVTYGGIMVAGRASPELAERARGLLNPLADESVKMRLDTWRTTFDAALDRPWGIGVGAVGSASASERAMYRTTDNSFLKVLVEQGIAGAFAFVLGLLGAVVLLARRLGRAAGEVRAVGLAALAGFAGFLVLSLTGEYVEQPGKVVAWALLGVAVACACRREAPAVAA